MKSIYRALVLVKQMRTTRNGITKCSIEKVNIKKIKLFTNKLFCKVISIYLWGLVLVT